MKTGLIPTLAVVVILGLGFLIWSPGTRNDQAVPQPAPGSPEVSLVSPSVAALEKPPAEPRSAREALAKQPAMELAQAEKTAAAQVKRAKVIASSSGLPTTDLVGADPESAGIDEGYALKYAQASQDERIRALEILRQTMNDPTHIPGDDKSVRVQLLAIKSEIGWLQDHLSP